MARDPGVTHIGPGTLRIDVEGKHEIVYVAGPSTDRWAFWNGHVFHSTGAAEREPASDSARRTPRAQSLSAPMPATVIRVLVAPGVHVTKGDTLVVLEAMKMELPVRALSDGAVTAVHCHEGELVEADQVLVDLA